MSSKTVIPKKKVIAARNLKDWTFLFSLYFKIMIINKVSTHTLFHTSTQVEMTVEVGRPGRWGTTEVRKSKS
jgi:hypothetical protein